MAYTRKQLEQKSELEIVAIGRSEFALELNSDTTPKAVLVNRVLDAQEAKARAAAPVLEEEEVEEPAPEEPISPEPEPEEEVVVPIEAAKKPAKAAAPKPPKRIRLVIHNQEGVDASPFVAVGINGFVYQIPREVEVSVPQEVIDVLNNAIVDRPEVDQTGRVVGVSQARRFPYSVLGVA